LNPNQGFICLSPSNPIEIELIFMTLICPRGSYDNFHISTKYKVAYSTSSHTLECCQVQVATWRTNNGAVSIGYQHVPAASTPYSSCILHDSRCTKVELQTTMDLTNRASFSSVNWGEKRCIRIPIVFCLYLVKII
jgi:hypothetical protein